MKTTIIVAIFAAALWAFLPKAEAGRTTPPVVTPPPKTEGPGVVSAS